MKTFRAFLILFPLLALFSCNPKVITSLSKYYAPLDYDQEVVVINIDQCTPEDAELLGIVKVGDTGFSTNCGYDIVIEKAKLEARSAGANVVKITKHTPPSVLGSSCHRISASLYRVEDIGNILVREEVEEEVLEDIDYAILNVYRFSGPGALVSYDLYLGDSVICRVKNNYNTTIHITKEGLNTLRAKTESKAEVPVEIIHGKTYYVRCGISMGVFVGHPEIELVDAKTGESEYHSFKTNNL